MPLMDLNLNPHPRELRVFGVGCAVLLAVIAALQMLRSGPHLLPLALLSLAATCALVALIRPSLLKWLYVGLTALTYPIGLVISWFLLAAVYYLVFTPIGLLRRALSADPLHRSFRPSADTYWLPRPSPPAQDRYFRQW